MRQRIGFLTGTTALFLGMICVTAKAQAPTTTQVTFKPFLDGAFITSMSADGSIAVGFYDSGTSTTAFRWTAAGGLQIIGTDKMFQEVYISRDGRVIVGTVADSLGNYHAAIWTSG